MASDHVLSTAPRAHVLSAHSCMGAACCCTNMCQISVTLHSCITVWVVLLSSVTWCGKATSVLVHPYMPAAAGQLVTKLVADETAAATMTHLAWLVASA
jgi:hypothetical protein